MGGTIRYSSPPIQKLGGDVSPPSPQDRRPWCPLSYTAVYFDARFQINSHNCLSYYTNNLANNGFATL